MSDNERSHEFNAARVIQHFQINLVPGEQFFGAQEVLIFANDHFGNLEEQAGTGTHDARTERAHQSEVRPVSPTAGIAYADDFGVRSWISCLHPQVVAAGHNPSLAIRQHRANGQASVLQTQLRFGQGFPQQFLGFHYLHWKTRQKLGF
jgi:hypothetical protein